jgi:hypothetical protein
MSLVPGAALKPDITVGELAAIAERCKLDPAELFQAVVEKLPKEEPLCPPKTP